MADWFVLYVRTGTEEHVLKLLERWIDTNVYMPFIPKKELVRFREGTRLKEKRICFPGYVFISSANDCDTFITNVVPLATRVKEAYYFLSYGGNKRDITMKKHEQTYIEQLLNDEFCMVGSIGFREGDRVRIIKGALMGIESQIIRINKRKCIAVVEFNIMGSIREATLMLEMIESL